MCGIGRVMWIWVYVHVVSPDATHASQDPKDLIKAHTFSNPSSTFHFPSLLNYQFSHVVQPSET